MPYAVYGRRSHKMKQAQNTRVRVLSGERRGGCVLSGETSGGGNHWGEWRGGSVFSGMRGKATAVSRAGSENSETVARR